MAAKAKAIGGIFFKCRNPENTKAWYARHLGISMDSYGSSFEWRKSSDKESKGYTAWAPFPEHTEYFSPSAKEFMINYRVDNLDELLAELRKNGVHVLNEPEVFPYGKFVHILGPEGEKIELWEPADEEYDKVAEGKTIS